MLISGMFRRRHALLPFSTRLPNQRRQNFSLSDSLILSELNKDNFRAVFFQPVLGLNKHQMWTAVQRNETSRQQVCFSAAVSVRCVEVPLNSKVGDRQGPTLSFWSVAPTHGHLFYWWVLMSICILDDLKKSICTKNQTQKNPPVIPTVLILIRNTKNCSNMKQYLGYPKSL